MMRTVIFFLMLLIVATSAQRRQQVQQSQQQSQDQPFVFDVAQFLTNRGGFGTIVTPAPDASTIRPVGTNQQMCNCVTYHACNDNVRAIDTNSEGRVETLSFFNSTCGHYLDVCCGGSSQNTENSQNPPNPSIPIDENPQNPNQPEINQPPNINQQPHVPEITPPGPQPGQQPSFPQYQNQGCGIRNTNGLDFIVNDVDVSQNLFNPT